MKQKGFVGIVLVALLLLLSIDSVSQDKKPAISIIKTSNEAIPGITTVCTQVKNEYSKVAGAIVELLIDFNMDGEFEYAQFQLISLAPYEVRKVCFEVQVPEFITEPTMVNGMIVIEMFVVDAVLIITEERIQIILIPEIKSVVAALKALDLINLQLPDIMPEGNAKSVSAKLDAAIKMILAGNYTAAINQLQAAINALDALSGKTIAKTTISESKVEAKKRVLQGARGFLQQEEEKPPKIPEVKESIKITKIGGRFTDKELNVSVEVEVIVKEDHLPAVVNIALVVTWLSQAHVRLGETKDIPPHSEKVAESKAKVSDSWTIPIPEDIEPEVAFARVDVTATAVDKAGDKLEATDDHTIPRRAR